MSTTRLQELLIGFGFGKQTDIATANAAITMWRLRKLNASMANPKLATENDAAEYGKGHEFATQTFKTSWDVAGSLEKYLGAEIGAWAMCFGLGKVVKSGTTPNFIYQPVSKVVKHLYLMMFWL
jgi:isoprenylcysteine carboxyl methyltransferase (ICMT) family protein YpbQ